MSPTPDDATVRKLTVANRKSQIDGLTKKLKRLVKEWQIAKLLQEKDEERTIFNEMKRIQAEIRKLEKGK